MRGAWRFTVREMKWAQFKRTLVYLLPILKWLVGTIIGVRVKKKTSVITTL